jgi:hypothetical protein
MALIYAFIWIHHRRAAPLPPRTTLASQQSAAAWTRCGRVRRGQTITLQLESSVSPCEQIQSNPIQSSLSPEARSPLLGLSMASLRRRCSSLHAAQALSILAPVPRRLPRPSIPNTALQSREPWETPKVYTNTRLARPIISLRQRAQFSLNPTNSPPTTTRNPPRAARPPRPCACETSG